MTEKLKLDPHVVCETLYDRVSKDVADASEHLTIHEIAGILYMILTQVTNSALHD